MSLSSSVPSTKLDSCSAWPANAAGARRATMESDFRVCEKEWMKK
jgi:hypothetical protein